MQDNNDLENTNPINEEASQDLPISPADTPPSLSTPETPTVANNPEILAVPPQQANKKKSKAGILITVVVLLLAVGGAALWYLQNKNNSTKQVDKVKDTQEIEVLNVGTTEGPASTYFPDEGLLGVYSVLNRQIYEGLVGFDNKKISPLIAQSWTNPNEKTWVFKIRPNVKFHTGKAVTAKELKLSLEDLRKFDYWSLFVSTIDTIEATGDLELTIKTKEPDALLLNRLTQAYIRDTAAPDAGGRNGTGAYQADSTAKNDEKSTTMVAFDGYYGARAKTRKLIYTIFDTDDEVVKAIKDKKIDIMETLTFPAIKKELTDAGLANVEYETPSAFGIYMNIARSDTTILKNKDIRLSIAQATNRQDLVDKLGNKNTPSYQVIPKSLPGHDTSIKMPEFDLAAAKATLTKAGYKNTPLEYLYIKELQLDAPILIEQLRAAGFNIKEKSFANADISKAIVELKAGKYDLFSAGYSSDVLDARDVLGSLLHSTESTYGPYNDPVFDKLLTDSDKEFDPVKRTQLLQQANKYIADNLVWIPTRNSVYNAYFSKDTDIKLDYVGGGNLGTYYRKVGRIVQ